jgi:hypothetical protein
MQMLGVIELGAGEWTKAVDNFDGADDHARAFGDHADFLALVSAEAAQFTGFRAVDDQRCPRFSYDKTGTEVF